MTYKEWEKSVYPEIKNDIVWKLEVYRYALYLSDLAWSDSLQIIERKHFSLADQLYRSSSSISANTSEGYSRISNKEKARFYEIALGSAREARGWYFKSRHILSDEVSTKRVQLITHIIRLMLKMITDRRKAHQSK
ncbi:MAG: four helix bundle protein [Balneolaceae bacterium]|nr:four helix bundle protein [Balneolaceae bacterium]